MDGSIPSSASVASNFVPIPGFPTTGSHRMELRALPYLFTWPIPDSWSSSGLKCSKSKAGPPSGVCASSVTKRATPSTTPIDSAEKNRRLRIFGRSSEPYPERYSPKPYSKSFVVHLESGYAQSHPDEDFAETFAVWLDPESQWRAKYSAWPAMKKLEYVDELMTEILNEQPRVTNRHTLASIDDLDHTLREHYRARRELHQVDFSETYDEDLLKLFSGTGISGSSSSAASFLSRTKRKARRSVAETTGIYQYTIDQIIEEMIERCRKLDLQLIKSTEETELDFVVLLTMRAVEHIRNHRYRLAL